MENLPAIHFFNKELKNVSKFRTNAQTHYSLVFFVICLTLETRNNSFDIIRLFVEHSETCKY